MTSTDVCRAWADANMLDMLDSGLANVSTALTQAQMWQHTLLVFSAVRPPSLAPARTVLSRPVLIFHPVDCRSVVERRLREDLWRQDNGGVGALGNNHPLRGHVRLSLPLYPDLNGTKGL